MGNKKLILGITAIFLVAAIFIISEKLTSISPPEHRTKFFPGLEERHITAVAVNENGGVIKLVKMDDVWMVGKEDDFQPANETLVQIAVERILSLKKSDLISDNPANRSNFGVDSAASASFVEIFTGDRIDPAYVVIIGKNGPDWNSNYVRLAGSDAVYLVPGILRQALFFDIERWKKPADPVITPDQAIDSEYDTESEPETQENVAADAAQ